MMPAESQGASDNNDKLPCCTLLQMHQARHVHHDGREPSKSQLRSNQFVRRPPQHLFNLIQGKIGSVSLESGSTNVVFPSENKCFLHQIPLLSASIKTRSRLLFFTNPGVFKSLHEKLLEMRRCWNVGEAEEAITRNFLSSPSSQSNIDLVVRYRHFDQHHKEHRTTYTIRCSIAICHVML